MLRHKKETGIMSKEEEDDAMSLDDDDEEEESSDSSGSESSDSDDDDDDDDDDESFDDHGADASNSPEATVEKHENGVGTNGVSNNGEAKHQSQTPPSAIPTASAAAAPSSPATMVKQENATSVEPKPVENRTAQPVAGPKSSVAVKAETSTSESNENDAKTANGSGPIIADEKKQETTLASDVIMQGTAEALAATETSDVVMAEAASPETKAAPPKEIKMEPKPSIETQPTHASNQDSLHVQTKPPGEAKPRLKIKLKLGNKAATGEANAKPSSLQAASIKTETARTEITNGNGAENGNATKAAASISSSTTGEPPEKKKKLSIVLKTQMPLIEKEASTGTTSSTVVKAEVVDDDGKAADVVAKVIEPTTAKNSGEEATAATKTPKSKKKAPSVFKPARLPPLTSPGMFLSHNAAGVSQASSALFRTAMDKKTFLAKPSVLFNQSMASAGYTTEERNKNPHRGSSVQKTVGDMFDSNVIFTPHFPELVPQELWNTNPQQKQQKQHENKEHSNASAGDAGAGIGVVEAKLSLPELLMKHMKSAKKAEIEEDDHSSQMNGRDHGGRKRRRPLQFKDMIPVSLTLPYPDSFLNQNQQYAKKVQERERAIVLYQEAQEKLQVEKEQNEFLYGKAELSGEQPKPNSVVIPPIPSKPTPPLLSELKGFDAEQYEDKYPLYFPKGKSSFVAHLDPDFFHVSEGRYFGLSSNMIADPHFVGASAPGLISQTLSAGSALATASTNSQGTGALLAVPMPTVSLSSSSGGSPSSKAQKKDSGTKKSSKKTAPAPVATAKSSSKTKINLKHAGMIPTATTSDLRKVLEKNDEMAKKMKDCIIRGAVRASRGEKHGLAFLGPDGNIYPDVSKAFAAHAGMKPCTKCKSNKQGVSEGIFPGALVNDGCELCRAKVLILFYLIVDYFPTGLPLSTKAQTPRGRL